MFTFDALVKLYNTIIKILVKLGWIKIREKNPRNPKPPLRPNNQAASDFVGQVTR